MALGCFLTIATIGLLTLTVIFLVVFLESGADTGEVVLLDQRTYPPGTIIHVAEHGFFVVRIGADLLAISDLDAANATAGRKCRARLVPPGSEVRPGPEPTLLGRASPEAEGSVLFLAEECNGAVYDVVGTRLDRDGPNLDRFAVEIDDSGSIVVDRQSRSCTLRRDEALRLERDC
ncbi:MAG TPA: hypothetical protein QGF35_04150 [Dehalococcoidia bacterium]|nr:hypothetical protein [Dehalococcoidia bacterium]